MFKYQNIACLLGAFFMSASFAKPIIVIDPGHEPAHPGAIGTCQVNELEYNDKIAMLVAKQLSHDYEVILTRESGQNVKADNLALPDDSLKKSLLARSLIANTNNAQIFISIHHDSTLLEHQLYDPTICNHQGGKSLSQAFKDKYKIGFNIFINDLDEKRKKETLLLAENIANGLVALGRTPANYHVYPIDSCRSCRPINEKLGIWYSDLSVLRNTTMPAILIEVGNIIDTDDEKNVNNEQFRLEFTRVIQSAVDQYFTKIKKI